MKVLLGRNVEFEGSMGLIQGNSKWSLYRNNNTCYPNSENMVLYIDWQNFKNKTDFIVITILFYQIK